MREIVKWAINNSPAMNTMLIASLVVGAISLVVMRREVFPEFELEIVLVSVPYPGASPEEIEQTICLQMEEALRNIDGVKKMTSVAQENAGFLILELKANVRDVQKVVNDCRSQISQIPSFPPPSAEDPSVQQITFKLPAISVGVMGPDDSELDPLTREKQLRALAEEVRDELLVQRPVKSDSWVRNLFQSFYVNKSQPAISSAYIVAARDYQIDVEVSEDQLRRYGLNLSQIAQIISQQNRELPAGTMEMDSQELRLRGNRKRSYGHEIENIVLVTQPNGDSITVGDISNVQDGFVDSDSEHFINKRKGMVVVAQRTSTEDLFTVVDVVKSYVAQKKLPEGYRLEIWGDTSLDVADRIDLLSRNGLQGLLLVFIVLAIFLDLRLSFWVAMGIPVSILGAGFVLILLGQTLNMLSMFAFLMALGIVVDDAIVIGENIYAKREAGLGFVRAAIEGTWEVIPSVTASVTTTIIAFAPLMFVTGIMGKFIAVMPLAVIAMLVISLLESVFVLPCHLAHENNLFLRILGGILYVFRPLVWCITWVNRWADAGMKWVIEKLYSPALAWSVRHCSIVVAGGLFILLIGAGFAVSGIVPFSAFPKLDSRQISATVVFPDGTASEFADQGTIALEQAIYDVQKQVQEEYGEDILEVVYRRTGEVGSAGRGPTGVTAGSHVGTVEVDLKSTAERSLSSEEIKDMWRARVGTIPGSDTVKFGSASMGPGGKKIEFKVLAPSSHADKLELAVEKCKNYLYGKQGVVDIEDDFRQGKTELILTLNEKGRSLNLDENLLSQNVRSIFYGSEVMRLQRGRNEVKLMVRYPEEERNSYAGFEEIRIRDNEGNAHPLTEVAKLEFSQAPAEINRINGYRSITVTADMDKANEAQAGNIIAEMQNEFVPELIAEFRNEYGFNLQVDWEGESQDSNDAFASMKVGFLIAMLAMYVLLTLAFRSYLQPLIILSIIPFGAIGAIFGHAVLGLDLTLFSFFGLIALTGVIVNDSIVLVDFINRHAREYASLDEALVAAGMRRFRPIMLTSFTTVAGLFPMLMERSYQAQVLIPMAASLVFGLMTGTLLILILVPVFYRIYVATYELATGLPFRIEEGLAADNAPADLPAATEPAADSKNEPAEAQLV